MQPQGMSNGQEQNTVTEPNIQTHKTRVDPTDGIVYEWNDRLKAWFPQATDSLIAQYQAAYGNNEEPVSSEVELGQKSDRRSRKNPKPEKEPPKDPEWFEIDASVGTHAYVSGLPLDITEDEFIDIMLKFGIIMEDPETAKLKIKLYRDADDNLKGDGLCCYLKPESVKLAIQILDDSDLRGNKIHIDNAHFELKGEYIPSVRAKKRKHNKERKQDKLLDWVERDEYKRAGHKRACVIHYLFDPAEFFNDPSAVGDYKVELSEECSKFGEVKKVFVFERSEEGVASILFKDEAAAQNCLKTMDDRLCSGRRLVAHIWDGVTKYQEEETEEERAERLRRWHESLEIDEK